MTDRAACPVGFCVILGNQSDGRPYAVIRMAGQREGPAMTRVNRAMHMNRNRSRARAIAVTAAEPGGKGTSSGRAGRCWWRARRLAGRPEAGCRPVGARKLCRSRRKILPAVVNVSTTQMVSPDSQIQDLDDMFREFLDRQDGDEAQAAQGDLARLRLHHRSSRLHRHQQPCHRRRRRNHRHHP